MARALVFPGQGSQYVGMGMELAERYPKAREVMDEADDALGFALSDIISSGPDAELTKTDISQPAILTVSWMAYKVLEQSIDGLTFQAVAGLSLGEYTALVAAGVLSFKDAVKLVRVRGQAMQAAADVAPSGMVALIGADEASAQSLCDQVRGSDVLAVANLNSPGQVVVSGSMTACERVIAAAKDHGIRRAMLLNVAGAFHSPLMASAGERLAVAIAGISLSDPKVPVYTNVSARAITSAKEIPNLLVQQLTSPVRWAQSVVNMHGAGVTQFWELGPGKALCGMIQRTVKDVEVANLDKAADVLDLAQKS